MWFDEQNFEQNISKEDVEKKERIVMCLMSDVERRELEQDKVTTFWMRVDNTECFYYVEKYTVEVPVKEHKRVEVVEAKEKELENLEKYSMFKEVEDERQEMVGSRWVIIRKA